MLKVIQVNSHYIKTAVLRNIQIQNNIKYFFTFNLFLGFAFRRKTAGGGGLEKGKRESLFRGASFLQHCHDF